MPVFSVSFILSVFLIFVRVAALIGTAPYFSNGAFPMRVKAFLAIALSIALFPTIPAQSVHLPYNTHVLQVLVLILKELLVGAAMGLTGQIIFGGIEMAGALMSLNVGLSFVNVVDPVRKGQKPIIGQLFGLLAIFVFLGIGGDTYYIRALAKSFSIVPVGSANIAASVPVFIKMATYLFIVGVQMAAPFIIVLFLLDVCLAIFARVMPQANIFFIALPLKLGVGIILLLLILPYTPAAFRHFFHQLWNYLSAILHALG
ncbi:MAG TPA: flagellar biosynthetic protein FliR [Balneolaceae bacterium]|nr:flagellar biosynthetic protein FliR [Balneolaceae bacterium]